MTSSIASAPARFFPATRIGLSLGICIGLVGAALLRPVAPPGVESSTDSPPIALPPAAAPPAAAPSTIEPLTPPPRSAPVPPVPDAEGRLRGPVVLQVWLEGCQDCMPAFDAWRKISHRRELADLPIVNVAYGGASPAFAAEWGVAENLVVDDGALVVRPYGIGSFTTLVLDAAGREVHRDRPDQPGYVERVRAAWVRASSSER